MAQTQWDRAKSLLSDTEPGHIDVLVERSQYGICRVTAQEWVNDDTCKPRPDLTKEFRYLHSAAPLGNSPQARAEMYAEELFKRNMK